MILNKLKIKLKILNIISFFFRKVDKSNNNILYEKKTIFYILHKISNNII